MPAYLTERDYPWLRALLDEYHRFAGRRQVELRQRLQEPLAVPCPDGKLRMAANVLDRLWKNHTVAAVPPKKARATLFTAAARIDDREQAIAAACHDLQTTRSQLAESLFADLPGERRLAAPAESLSIAELALRTNSSLVAGILKRSQRVSITVYGNSRALVRQAKLHGLLCTVSQNPSPHAVDLEISGPFTLFRRTLIYGRALASLVSRLAWCHRFTLQADCHLGPEAGLRTLVLRTGDPIFPAGEAKRYDSKIEQRLAQDLARAATDWELVREPVPLSAGQQLVFPDFGLRHRRHRDRYWHLEIVGFWTPQYLQQKLAALRRARLNNFILCIDEQHNCSDDQLPANARVIRFRRRVDAAAIIAVIEAG